MDYLDKTAPSDAIVHRLLERRAAAEPDATFYTLLERNFTFAQVNSDANRLARNLRDAGITAGTHVAVLMETSEE